MAETSPIRTTPGKGGRAPELPMGAVPDGAVTTNGNGSGSTAAPLRSRRFLPGEGSLEIGELRDYLRTLRRRKRTVLAITAFGLVASFAYVQLQTPRYTSTASVLATNPLAAFIPVNSLAAPNMDDERTRVTAEDVARCATQLLAEPSVDPSAACSTDALTTVVPFAATARIDVSVPENTNVLRISFSDPAPRRAQAVAQAFAQSYVAVRTNQALDYLKANQVPLQAQADDLNRQIAELDQQIAKAIQTGASKGRPVNVTPLQTRVLQLANQLQVVNAQLIGLSPTKLNPPTLETPASLPASPSSPKRTTDIAIGLVLGLVLGMGIAVLHESMSDRLRGREDLEDNAATHVLAVIPRLTGFRRTPDQRVLTITQPDSAFVEAFRALRARILFNTAQTGLKVIMVVSPNPKDGKTTVAANLAVVLSETGKRVTLIEGDLRRPRVARLFHLDPVIGLANVLDGECTLDEALQDSSMWNLTMLPSGGPVLGRPANLLQSERMVEVLEVLRETSDFVVIDTPPILLVADALALTPWVDGIVIVANAENTTRQEVLQTRNALDQVHAPVTGAVLNGFRPGGEVKRYGYYGYGFPRPI